MRLQIRGRVVFKARRMSCSVMKLRT